MTLESVYDVHRAPSGEFTFICRHPDEKMAHHRRGLVSARTRRVQHVFAHYRTLEDCLSVFFFVDGFHKKHCRQ